MNLTTPSKPRPLIAILSVVGAVCAFLLVFTVGPFLLPESIGTYSASLWSRLICALSIALAVGLALAMFLGRERPVGRPGVALLGLVVCLVPAWLFLDPLTSYWIYGDDWEYLASSRTLSRMVENLFTPHNVHVVPVWRFVSWVVVASAGSLAKLPEHMALASYACLVATMILAGRFVARETRSAGSGLMAMVVLGTTPLMQSAGTWFSAAQALGAAFGVLLTLWYLQAWKRSGKPVALILAVLSTAVAGWSWTVGYAAGPVGAAYLLADGRRRSLKAAILIVLSSGLIGATTLKVAGKAIQEQSTISFHGRKTTDAISPASGLFHTIQAIPERLILGDLGVVAEINIQQASTFVVALGLIWVASRRGKGWMTPLEASGLSLVVVSYGMEWIFRGYLPFSSLRGFVPWYETIPQVGFALFVVGWWSAIRLFKKEPGPRLHHRMTRGDALILLTLQAALATLTVPRADAIFVKSVRPMLEVEIKDRFPIPRLQRLWAIYVASDRADRQRRMLARLDRAETIARKVGIGRESLRVAQGRTLWPDPPVIDDADMLDLPRLGVIKDPEAIRRWLGPSFVVEPEPRPFWVPQNVPWPPSKSQ